MPWIKNTKGEPDAMLTFATVAFAIVAINLLLSTFGTVVIAGATISFAALSPSVIGAILTPTLGAYVARRLTGSAYNEKKPDGNRKTLSVESISETVVENIEDYLPTGER